MPRGMENSATEDATAPGASSSSVQEPSNSDILDYLRTMNSRFEAIEGRIDSLETNVRIAPAPRAARLPPVAFASQVSATVASSSRGTGAFNSMPEWMYNSDSELGDLDGDLENMRRILSQPKKRKRDSSRIMSDTFDHEDDGERAPVEVRVTEASGSRSATFLLAMLTLPSRPNTSGQKKSTANARTVAQMGVANVLRMAQAAPQHVPAPLVSTP
jgi:hypothetical protein